MRQMNCAVRVRVPSEPVSQNLIYGAFATEDIGKGEFNSSAVNFVEESQQVAFIVVSPAAILVVGGTSYEVRRVGVNEVVAGQRRNIELSEIETLELTISPLNAVDEIHELILHFGIEVALADGEIKLASGVEANLIVERIDDEDVERDVVPVVKNSGVVKIGAQSIERLAVEIAETGGTVAVIVLVAVTAH